MQETEATHHLIKQHDKLGISLSSNVNHYLPADVFQNQGRLLAGAH